jgi:hypothetical protein
MITVYHNERFVDFALLDEEAAIKMFNELPNNTTVLKKVAEVNTDDLEKAFELTNHIDHSWEDNPEVTLIEKSRSTSTGDIMEKDEKLYIVLSVGFAEVK